MEEDEAASDQPAAAWTGARIAALFRDEREAEPRLRVTLRESPGAAPVLDEPVATAAVGTEEPVMAWDGMGLALAWREGADADLAFTRLLESGDRALPAFYLVRAIVGAAPGSDAPDDGRQTPDRDAGIAAAAAACP